MVTDLSTLSADEIQRLKGALEAELKGRGPSRERRVPNDAPEVQEVVAVVTRLAADLDKDPIELLAACIEYMALPYMLRRKPKSAHSKSKEQP